MKIRWGFASIAIAVFIALALCLYCKFIGDKFRQRSEGTDEYALNRSVDEDVAADGDLGDEIEDDVEDYVGKEPIDIYFAESERLRKVFDVRGEQLLKEAEAVLEIEGRYVVDYKRWEKEYYQPLYREVKNAMARVWGTDDYLAIWENLAFVQEISTIDLTIPYAYRIKFYPTEISLDLLTIYSLAILYDNRENILNGTIYEDSEIGDQYRKKYRDSYFLWNLFSPRYSFENALLTTGGGFLGEEMDPIAADNIRSIFHKMNIWLIFPPRYSIRTTFDNSWHIMAIYSFKNERARKILYEIATNNIDDYVLDSLARFATFYLSFFYDSFDLIPPLNERLENAFDQFYNQCPESFKEQLNGKDAKDLTSGEFNNILEEFKKKHPIFNYDFIYSRSSSGSYLIRLLKLRDSLLFNEKIPSSERERFDIVRRELAISWALTSKLEARSPQAKVFLREGEEHFVEYLREYYVPGPTSPEYFFEEHE